MVEMIGKKFGRLLVVRLDHRDSRYEKHWTCKCDCGNEKIVGGKHLRNGKIQSCGCLAKEKLSKYSRENGHERNLKRYGYNPAKKLSHRIIHQYRTGARVRGLEFFLTEEDAIGLFNSPCYYCGEPPSNLCKRKDMYGELYYNGIDRLDNTKDYTIENSVACCWRCNRVKGDWGENSFRAWIEQVHNHLMEVS